MPLFWAPVVVGTERVHNVRNVEITGPVAGERPSSSGRVVVAGCVGNGAPLPMVVF